MGWGFDLKTREEKIQDERIAAERYLDRLVLDTDFSDLMSVVETQNYLFNVFNESIHTKYAENEYLWGKYQDNFDAAYAQAREDGVASDALDNVYQTFLRAGVAGVDKIENLFSMDSDGDGVPDIEAYHPEYYSPEPSYSSDEEQAAAERDYERKYKLLMDIDGDGRFDSLTDGLMMLRYLFGLRGDDVTAGAISEEATRTAAEIEAYLTDPKVRKVLDFDQDGRLDPLTDALMALRYSFGLRGEDMTDGAISADSEFYGNSVAMAAHMDRVLDAAFVLDEYGNRTDELIFDAVASVKPSRIKDDTELDKIQDRYNYDDLDNPVEPESNTPVEPESNTPVWLGEQDGTVLLDVATRGVTAESLGMSQEEFEAYYDYNRNGKVNSRDSFDLLRDQNMGTPWEFWTETDFEAQMGEPEPVDSDSDGTDDINDAFPNDPNEWADADGDGVGNNADAFISDPTETEDSDNDGTGDNADAFPNDPAETTDSDNDGTGDNADAFPNDPAETTDSDNDGTGNNADAFPNDPAETIDSDNDGTGNNADAFPNDPAETTDSDNDGVGNNADFNPDDPAIKEAPQFEDGTDVGWPVTARGTRSRSSLIGVGFSFDNGMATDGKTLYQGYSTPLTVDEIIAGYLSIKETGTWTDPRYAKYAAERADYASSGSQPPDNLTLVGLETVEINNQGGQRASAEQFLQEYTVGKFFFEGQRGGDGQVVNINYGRTPDGENEGEFITLEDLFNARMPHIEGIGRPEQPLAPEFVDGVDTLPTVEELGNFYYDIVITAGYDYANAYMNALPEEAKQLWDGRNVLPSLQDSPQFVGSLLTSIGLSDLLEVGDLTKLDPTKIQDWVYTIEDGASKANAQSIHDAVKKYQDDPLTLSYEDRHFLHVFKLMEPSFYGTGVSELEPLDLADDTLLDQISDLKTHQDIMANWTNRVDVFPYVEEAVSDRYRDEEAPEDDPYWKPSTYGISQLGLSGGGLNFDGTSGLAYYIDGSPVDPNMGIPYSESLYTTYGANWLRGLQGKDMPLYQETDTLGAPADLFDTYATLQGKLTEEQLNEIAKSISNNADYRALSPAIPVLEYLRKDGGKIAKEVGAMGGASEEEILEYFELQESVNGYKLDFGGAELWYDPTKLYMKIPQDDNSDIFPTRFNQEGQVSNQMWVLDSYDEGYSPFAGEMPTYFDDFANAGEENQGNGWLVDITGGNAPVGSYSMVWVAQPEYQDSWDRVLSDPFFNLFVSVLVPGGSIILASLKHLNGQTLKTEDWIGVVIDGLKLSGNLKLPATPEEATTAAAESGDAARELAEAEAIADGFTGQTVISMGQFAYDAAYSAEYVTMLEGIGIAGLSAKQSVTLIRAMGSGDDLGTVLLGSFGDEYVTKALGGLGFDTSNISPEIMDSVTNIATDMLDDKSFEEAIASEAGGLLVDYFEGQFDALEGSPRLKQFLETVKSELKDATDAVGSIASNLGESLEPLYDAVKDVITEEDIKGLVDGSKSILNSFEFITEGISGIATGIEKEMLDPLTDVFKQGLTKFTTMASIDLELTGDLDADLDNFFGGVGNASKSTYDNLGESLKEVFKESVGQQIVTGEISNDDLYKIFSRELVAIDAISQLDPDPGVVRNIVDAIGPQVLTSALRNTLNAAMAGGETDKVFLDTIAQSAVNALRTAHDAGGLAGVTEAFNDFGTKITGTYGEVKAAAKAYNDLDNQLTALLKRRKALADDLATAKQEKQTLEAAALAEGATIADIDAYTEYAENYVGAVNVIDTEIKAVDGAMDGLEVAYTTAKNAYDNSVGKLTAETQNLDSAVQLQYDDLYIKVIQGINPDINLGEYAAANNLPEGSTAADVAKHYLRVGAKEGLPVTREEAVARQMSAISSFAIGVFDKAGIDISALNNSDRAKVLNKLTEDANKAIEDEGISAVEYLENAVKSLETDAVSDIEAYVASALSSDPDNPASIAQINEALQVRNAYQGITQLYRDNGLWVDDISNEMVGKIARGEVTYSYANDGRIVWGDDEPGTNGNWEQTEWDADEQRFVTYQYNSVSSTRVEVNAEGNVVGGREEFTPVDTTIDFFAETNPVAFAALVARADSDAAMHAENGRIVRMGLERPPIFNITQDMYKDVPEIYLPYVVRAVRSTFESRTAEANKLAGEISELEALTPNVPPEDMAAHQQAIDNKKYEMDRINDDVEAAAQTYRIAESAATGLNNTVIAFQTGSSIGTVIQASDTMFNLALTQGKSLAEATKIKQDFIKEHLSYVDMSMSNELTTTLNALEGVAYGYLPDSYKDDLNNIMNRWGEADGFIESVEAVFGSFGDYPATFATEFIGNELVEEIVPIMFGGIYGKIATKAVISAMDDVALKALGPDVVQAMFSKNAKLGAFTTDLSMAFGGAVDQTYQQAYDLAIGTGQYSETEAQAVAAQMAFRAGAFAVTVVGSMPRFNLALDSAIFKGTTKNAVQGYASRVATNVDIVAKETISEILEETGVVGLNEVAYYNMGYTDRDVAGEIGNAAALSGIASAGTTSSILGIKTTFDAVTGDTNNPFAFTAATQNPQIAAAIEEAKSTGDTTTLTQLLTAAGIASMPLATDIYNMVDDQAYVTRLEAEQSFDRLGVDPTEDMLASAMTLDDTALDDDLAYTLSTEYGMEESIGTGRTSGQHYDIIQHIQNMANGVVPLDSSFNQNGDNMVDQADVDTYIAKLPRYEREQYQNYDATAHQDTGIVQELGGSLMTIDELNELKSNINTLMNRDVPPTKEEIVALLTNDPAITGLPGQIEAAVNTAFAKKENKEAFAAEVITQMIDDETIKTISQDSIKEVMGDPDGLTDEEKGIFGVVEGLKDMLDLGESDAETLAEYISDAVGTAGTFKDGVYQDDGTGLLGDLTKQGVLQDVAIAEITSILGSEEAGTGLYAIANDASNSAAAVARIESEYGTLDTDYTALKNLYDTAITNLQTNLGSPDGNPDVVGNQPTGLYALVGKAITAGNNATGAVETILGDYVDFAAFETALGVTIDGKIDEIETLFGTPPVYQLNSDGTIKRDEETSAPLLEKDATGYQLALYNAMQLQGVDRDLAIETLQVDLNQKITDLQDFTTNATAEKIKTEILDVYFPAKPDNFDTGRTLAVEEDYVRGLVASGEYDARVDYNDDQEISVVEWRANRTPAQVEAQDAYNTWADNTTGITPALENLSIETGTNFALLNQRVDAVQTGVTDYIRENVLNLVGKPADGVNDASGIFLAIEEGDDAVLDVLGAVGEDGSGVLRSLELLGLSTSEIQTFLDTNIGKPAVSADEATADNPQRPASGIFELFEQNTENYNSLVADYDKLAGDALTLAGEFQTLSTNTANKITAIDTTIGTLPTDEDGDGVFEGGSGLRLELFNQGLSIDEVNNVLGSEDNTDSILGKLAAIKSTADSAATTSALSAVSGNLTTLAGVVGTKDANSGLFGAIDSLATTTASNTEKYENLLSNYSDISGKYDTLAGEYQTLSTNTANKITAIDNTIGTLPTDEDGDGVFEGGSGLRLELFNQGLSIDEVNNVLGSEDNTDSILGKLAAIKSTADSAATTSALSAVSGNLTTLAGVVGTKDANSGLFGAIDSLATTTASNTEKYENLLSNYSDISGKYDTLAGEYQTLSTNTANKITAIDNTIGTLPTDEDGDGVFEGGSGLRLELFNQGLSIDEVNNVLGSEDNTDSILGKLAAIKSTADSAATTSALSAVSGNLTTLAGVVGTKDANSGLFGAIDSLATTTASNTEKYENLLSNYSDISGKYDTLAGEYQTLSTNTANKITAIDNTIGTLPTDEDGDGVFEGGSGLRLELFNQGLSIDEVNNVLGSEDNTDSILGKLAAIKSTADGAATTSALSAVSGNLTTLAGVVGTKDDNSGLFGAIDSLATTTASNTEKYENLLSNYSDISGKYDTLAGEYQTLSTNTANKITAIDNTIGTLPTDEDGDGVFEGGSGLRLELFNQGLSIDEVNNVLGSEDNTDSILGKLAAIKSTADSAATTSALSAVSGNLTTLAGVVGTKDANSGLFGAIDSLATTTASNTEKYENLLSNYSDISGKYDTLAGEYQTLSTNTANKITAIDNTIGTLPTDEDGDGVFEGGSGLRLELFNQGLSIDEVNNVLGSEDNTDSILGKLAAIKSTADSAATTSALSAVSGNLTTLAGVVGTKDANSGLFGAIDSLATTTASNTEKYENLLSNYSDISGKYDTLTADYQTLSTNTANKITAIDNTIGTLPTDEDGDGVFEGGSGLRLELFNQGLSIDEVNNVLGSEDNTDSILGKLKLIKDTADGAATTSALSAVSGNLTTLAGVVGTKDDNSGLFGAIDSLATTTASNTEKYENLLSNYSDISGKYDTLAEETADLAGEYQTLADSTADKITAIDNTIGTLPEYNEETEQFEGGSGLRLELFNQGLSIAQIEALLGSEDDTNSILGRLKTIKDATDLSAKQANLTALEGIVGNAESGLVKTVNDIAQGIVDREAGYNALVGQVSGIAEDYDARFEEFDTALTDVATSAQVEDVQDTVNQIADFMGIPPNEVTQQDMEAFAVVIADFEMDAERVAQEDMLRYDVSGVDGTPDGQIDVYDQQVLQAGLEGDYSGFAPDAQFNQATGMFLERQQDQNRIAELEQERINQEAEFEAQRQADLETQAQRDAQLRTDLQADFQEDLDERKEAEEREEYLKAFTAPGRTRTTTTPQDPADIRYFYDIAGDDIFANQQQDEFYGAASPFGDNFMNEILTPQRKKAKGGLIDETDEILKILGE